MTSLRKAIKSTFGESQGEHTSKLFEIQDEIESLEKRLSELRASAKIVAANGAADLAPAGVAISSLYWVGSMLGCAGIIKDTYRAATGRQLSVSSLIGTSECRHCNGDIHTEISSAMGLRQWLVGSLAPTVCAECEAKAKQRSAAEKRQNDLRKSHLARMPYREYLKTPE